MIWQPPSRSNRKYATAKTEPPSPSKEKRQGKKQRNQRWNFLIYHFQNLRELRRMNKKLKTPKNVTTEGQFVRGAIQNKTEPAKK